jgi:hypothetical protein
MKYKLIILCAALAVSCQSIEHSSKPDKLIAEDRMVDIFYDLSLIEASKRLGNHDVDVKELDLNTFIYEKYDIDSAQLVQNTTYYSDNIPKFKSVFARVENRLKVLKTELDSLRSKENRKKDSLKRAAENVRKDSLSSSLEIAKKLNSKISNSEGRDRN